MSCIAKVTNTLVPNLNGEQLCSIFNTGSAVFTSYITGSGLDLTFFTPMLNNLPSSTSQILRSALSNYEKP